MPKRAFQKGHSGGVLEKGKAGGEEAGGKVVQ